MESTDTKATRWAAREAFFEAAARFTPMLAVDTKCGRFLVSTRDPAVGGELFARQFLPEMRTLRRVVRVLAAEGVLPAVKGKTFVDVGASIGISTVTALQAGFTRAVAFEPAPERLELLRQNIVLNGFGDRVELLEGDYAAPLDALVRSDEVGLVRVGAGDPLAGAASDLGVGVMTAVPAHDDGASVAAAAQEHFTGFVDLRGDDDVRPIAELDAHLREASETDVELLLIPAPRAAEAPEAAVVEEPDVRQELASLRLAIEHVDRTVSRRVMGRLDAIAVEVEAVQRRLAIDAAALPYPERLLAQRFRLHSQNEEDGVLLALLEAAGIGPRRFVELGCGDNGGNSGMLADELGFSGLMVDGGEREVAACRRQFPRATVTQAWIERETVDALVASHGFSGELDLLSVDLDGNDIYVWDALTSVAPRIAIAEYNSLMGADASVAIAYDREFVLREVDGAGGGYFGASLSALTRSMAKRGMRLVTTDHRGVNAFFLREDVAPQVPAIEPARAFRVLHKHQRMIDEGYDLARVCDERGLDLVPYD